MDCIFRKNALKKWCVSSNLVIVFGLYLVIIIIVTLGSIAADGFNIDGAALEVLGIT